MKKKREILDSMIGGTVSERDERELQNLERSIATLRTNYIKSAAGAQKDWEKRMEQAAKEAAKNQ